MQGIARPLASLSSGLLARKGQARPAMRPQGFAEPAPLAGAALEDLGWNDLGAPEPVVSAPAPVEPAPLPPVLAARAALHERIAAPAAEPARDVSLATARRIGRDSAAQTRKGKAAFTLRLEPHRHLRLRLASAVAGRSAQALVAEALDRFLETMPTVEALAVQLPVPAKGADR